MGGDGEVLVSKLLQDWGAAAEKELKTPVKIVDVDEFPDTDELPLEARRWTRVKDVVVVVADLKDSTKLNFDVYANTSASLYEAVTGNLVRIVDAFDPDFVDIQGDGLFALFHGSRRYERALCAGISIKTFSTDHLAPAIEELMSFRFPKTGLKVGIAAGLLVVKRVGVRGTHEPVWAGKPVNWATKCAGSADCHGLIATQKVFQKFAENDYVTHSCGCTTGLDGTRVSGGIPRELWVDVPVETLPEDDVRCKRLTSQWCEDCGDEFCNAVLRGDKHRDEVSGKLAA
jgi:class 3 adenylate cyclase